MAPKQRRTAASGSPKKVSAKQAAKQNEKAAVAAAKAQRDAAAAAVRDLPEGTAVYYELSPQTGAWLPKEMYQETGGRAVSATDDAFTRLLPSDAGYEACGRALNDIRRERRMVNRLWPWVAWISTLHWLLLCAVLPGYGWAWRAAFALGTYLFADWALRSLVFKLGLRFQDPPKDWPREHQDRYRRERTLANWNIPLLPILHVWRLIFLRMDGGEAFAKWEEAAATSNDVIGVLIVYLVPFAAGAVGATLLAFVVPVVLARSGALGPVQGAHRLAQDTYCAATMGLLAAHCVVGLLRPDPGLAALGLPVRCALAAGAAGAVGLVAFGYEELLARRSACWGPWHASPLYDANRPFAVAASPSVPSFPPARGDPCWAYYACYSKLAIAPGPGRPPQRPPFKLTVGSALRGLRAGVVLAWTHKARPFVFLARMTGFSAVLIKYRRSLPRRWKRAIEDEWMQ